VKATSTARSPFPWFGGKQRMADRIIGLFPPHSTYVEVFGGGASVLLSKPEGMLDVYNDRDDGLVNFFRVLRDRPAELVPLLELTPYARSEWEFAGETWADEPDPVERARLWYVVAAGSFAGFAARDNGDSGRGWGGEKLGRMHLSRAASTANRIDHIWRFVERLRTVQIDNLGWRECLDRYDHPDCLFYLDPPYVPETRRAGGYRHELTAEDHAELVSRVLELRGIAIVSGYDHALYEPLVGGGFTRHEWGVWSTAARGVKGSPRDRRVEIVWASPRAAHGTLFGALAEDAA
jgi:DNA adenine methylase